MRVRLLRPSNCIWQPFPLVTQAFMEKPQETLRFMAGVRSLRVPSKPLKPSWDLLVILRALTVPPHTRHWRKNTVHNHIITFLYRPMISWYMAFLTKDEVGELVLPASTVIHAWWHPVSRLRSQFTAIGNVWVTTVAGTRSNTAWHLQKPLD